MNANVEWKCLVIPRKGGSREHLNKGAGGMDEKHCDLLIRHGTG